MTLVIISDMCVCVLKAIIKAALSLVPYLLATENNKKFDAKADDDNDAVKHLVDILDWAVRQRATDEILRIIEVNTHSHVYCVY